MFLSPLWPGSQMAVLLKLAPVTFLASAQPASGCETHPVFRGAAALQPSPSRAPQAHWAAFTNSQVLGLLLTPQQAASPATGTGTGELFPSHCLWGLFAGPSRSVLASSYSPVGSWGRGQTCCSGPEWAKCSTPQSLWGDDMHT